VQEACESGGEEKGTWWKGTPGPPAMVGNIEIAEVTDIFRACFDANVNCFGGDINCFSISRTFI
jgi:hypothetical protein